MILFDGRKRVYKGNLHTHTTLSDGRKDPEEVIEIYRAHGYDFLAITDHRRFSLPLEYREGFTILPGSEFDFFLPAEVIHIVGIGVTEEMANSFKKELGPQAAIDRINACGGFPILAHPAWSLNKPATMMALKGVNAAEVFNSVSGLPWNADRADSTVLLEQCAASGRLFNFLANDDSHWYEGEECRGWNMVAADDLTMPSLLDALRKGNFYSTQGPEIRLLERNGNEFRIECSEAKAIWCSSDLVYNKPRALMGENLTSFDYTALPERGETYVRFTVEDANGNRAWTNPIAI